MLTIWGRDFGRMSGKAGARHALTAAVSAQQEQTRALVRAMMTLTGLSASALAREAGLTPSTLNRFMHRPVRHTLSQRTLLALMSMTFRRMKAQGIAALDANALAVLAPALPVFERAILDQAPDAEKVLKEIKLRTGAGLAPAAARHEPRSEAPHDLPVITASTSGIDIAGRDFGKAPLTTQRPPFLADDLHAFAFLLTDASMSPRYDPGDMLYISPGREIGSDNVDVVVERTAGGFFVARLVGTSDTSFRFLKLPTQDWYEFPRAESRGLYRVVGVQRLGG